MFKITIPKPCFEGWNNMMPNEKGRYCNSCAKTVVDFSVMSDEAVQQYFIANYDQKICGRFKNTQLQRIIIELPQNIFRIALPFWKRFLIVFLICFGGSFLAIDTTIAGMNYKQGEPIAAYKKTNEIKTGKKKPAHLKKKKRRRRTTSYLIYLPHDFDPTVIMVYGNIWTPEPKAFPFYPAISGALKQPADTGINTASDNPQKNPSPAIPDPGAAFILPTVLAMRNPFSKKKKV
jgi:hypothetical protein